MSHSRETLHLDNQLLLILAGVITLFQTSCAKWTAGSFQGQRRFKFACICLTVIAFSPISAGHRKGRPSACYDNPRSCKTKGILTYNTALTHHLGLGNVPPGTTIPDRESRRDAIIERLKRIPASVVCLQEVYTGQDVTAIVDALGEKFPHSHSKIHDDNGQVPLNGLSNEPACEASKFAPLGACFQANCLAEETRPGLINCIAQSCFNEFSVLSQDCWNCIFNAGLNITEVAVACTAISGPGPYRKPTGAGLLLLSKTPLSSPLYVDFHPGTQEIFERGYIQAEVSCMGTVVCAHTSYVDPPVPGPYFEFELQAAGFTNYTQQNLYEVTHLAEKFGNDKRTWVVGDLNTGPECSKYGVDEEGPEKSQGDGEYHSRWDACLRPFWGLSVVFVLVMIGLQSPQIKRIQQRFYYQN